MTTCPRRLIFGEKHPHFQFQQNHQCNTSVVMIYDVKDKFFEAYIIAFRSQGVDGNRGEMRGGSKSSGGNSAGGGGGGRTNSGGKPL